MRAMLRHLLFAYQFNLDRGRVMVKDLSDEQIADVVAFLHTLDCNSGLQIFEPPTLP